MTHPRSTLTLTPTLLASRIEDLASGERPLLLVGPSLGTSVSALWGPAVPHLQEQFVVIGWDLPGHGASRPSDGPYTLQDLADGVEEVLAGVVAEHGVPSSTPVLAAGVSIGGATTLTLAQRPGTRIDRLAAICTAARIGTPEGWAERAELVAQAGTPTMVEGSAQRWFAPGFMAEHPRVATSLLQSLQHADRHSYAHACHALGTHDLTGRLDRFTRPLLVINGAEDTVCPPADAAVIADGAAAGSVPVRAVTLPDVAHLAPAEAPEATARLLEELLDD
ncbi:MULTISPECIES: alpha/beta fold hydrolase [Actinomycetes]|uniref:Serine aminopeptidase S33 domain-containing protein n=2 Tax=Actinomycetes TaxID=1760 RepID=A0ABP6LS20_9MICC